MKLSTNTYQILKNFSEINSSILIKKGRELKTMSIGRTIFASALIDEVFEVEVPIYNLPRFLQTLSLFDDPELDFQEKFVIIKGNNTKIRYNYAEASLIKYPKVVSNSFDFTISFELSEEILFNALKSMSVLSLNHLSFVGDKDHLKLEALAIPEVNSDLYSVDLGETDQHFKVHLKKENLLFIKNDYNVEIDVEHNIVKFSGDVVEYIVAAQDKEE
jgi:hypothetical protein